MRYPASQTAERHEKILHEASRLFRSKGIAGASIAEVMKASGLTHGAFYAHFDSKEALACASVEHAMDQLARELSERVSAGETPKESPNKPSVMRESPQHLIRAAHEPDELFRL